MDIASKRVSVGSDCDVNNMASVSLAEKLGFNEPAAYSVFVKI
ncbi:GNAT family N-acetyltransferase [Bacillus nakamurai]|nr:GNAT family N-acetyltransferase [Bacillus nakamurai]MED1228775.1 GNAT family N-acetyltransferase [Bacillus nakamurai]